MARLIEERDKAVGGERDTASMAKVVGEECFNNVIEHIRFLNPDLHINTEGMSHLLNVVGGQL